MRKDAASLSILLLAGLACGLVIVFPGWVELAHGQSYNTLLDRVGTQLANICGSTTNSDVMMATCLGDDDDDDDDIYALAHDELPGIGTGSTAAAFTVIEDLSTRLYSLRHGASGIQIAGLRDSRGKSFGGSFEFSELFDEDSAAGADVSQNLGGFMNGYGGFGDKDATNEETGFTFVTGGLITGLDYRITDDLVAGAAFSWLRQDSEFRGSRSELEVDSYGGSLYGYFAREGFYLDGIFTYAYKDYDLKREVALSFMPTSTVEGNPDGHEISFSAGSGYEFLFEGLSFGPTARVDVVHVMVDDYTESGMPGVTLTYDDFDLTSVSTNLGGSAAYAVSTVLGVLTPQLHAEWVHEFQDDAETLDAVFSDDPAAGSITVRTDTPDRNYARFGAGASMQFEAGFSAFFDWEMVLGLTNVQKHQFTLGGRVEFNGP